MLYVNGKYNRAHQVLLHAKDDPAAAAHLSAIAYYLAKDSFEDGNFARAVDEMTAYRQTTSDRLSRGASPE